MIKQKSFNSSSAFTLLELLVVIIIIGIIIASVSFNFSPNNLQLAADQLIKDIRFTQSLALKDDKYQPFPNANNLTEYNRTKYWFKQWWQIRFSYYVDSNGVTHQWYEIFSDQPDGNHPYDNFDKLAKDPSDVRDKSIAKDPLTHKLMIGHCNITGNTFPLCSKIDSSLDLTKTYSIKKIEFSSIFKKNYSKRILFDNIGNVFIKESNSTSDRNGDVGDINPLDYKSRIILTENAYLRLCLDNPCIYNSNRCIQINISPNGVLWKSNCSN